jgi:hypothetical protein
MRAPFAGLCAVLALAASTSASDVPSLIPAQPVAPTRTEQMGFGALPVAGVGGVAVGGECATEAGRRRWLDGTFRQSLRDCLARYGFGVGVAMSPACNCFAAERSFIVGSSCNFFMPGLECVSCGWFGRGRFTPIEYGPGYLGAARPCR